MEIDAIAATVPLSGDAATGAGQPEQIGRQFEALLFEMLFRETGLAGALTTGTEGELAPLGDLFAQVLASELSQQVDLGLGRLATAAKS